MLCSWKSLPELKEISPGRRSRQAYFNWTHQWKRHRAQENSEDSFVAQVELQMSQEALRSALRTHTADAHKNLDTAVGDLSDVESYRTFIAQSYAFRFAVEPTIQALPNLAPLILAGTLRQDLDDLGYGQVDTPTFKPMVGRSASLGRLYVLEGSSVGARVLYQRARKLGFSESYGARHLALQVTENARWKRFIALLDTVESIDRSEALSGAQELFAFATAVYTSRHI